MKSFTEYLTESKKTYDFKIKVAGDCPEKCGELIKSALSMYEVASISEGSTAPIQESHFDFPEEKNVKVTFYDVSLSYPSTSPLVRAAVANKLKKTESQVIVRNPTEEAEILLNHAHDAKSGESVLNKTYEKENNQNMVGEKQKMKMLKELGKNKGQLSPYKMSTPKSKTTQIKSPVGSNKVTKPEVRTAGGR